MYYWSYRAYDDNLQINEGMLVSDPGNNDQDQAFQLVMLQLRQHGLQAIELRQIDQSEYLKGQKIQQLKDYASNLISKKHTNKNT